MVKRTTITNKGKRISFEVDANYFYPEHINNVAELTDKVFNGSFVNMEYCVLYTKVKVDWGEIYENRWGVPVCVRYNNGLVGYQCGDFYHTEEEAKKHYEARLKLDGGLTKQFDTCDVMLIKNNIH